MDVLIISNVQEEVTWCMFFVVDIVLIDKIQLYSRSEILRDIFKLKRFRLSKFKIKYIECKFSSSV